ncbi:Gfo/Idh/MocA family oxidoreductase [Pseudarthrobacter phenanthrenivorans]|uniref:Gfo/Idh/MocA family protein n=1 Tax=Pseudarthrobacter phenanthrenivorans TaxID=361575 RepID=UPI00112C25ED|nr:Gfo/Idh/MocA family oxidoreductase [Pseudarthrobacter phenanthrenivorans]TPV51111.1 Gfo/Idh/MocA family oxidoreductase [Pseudarthrobacter phenanthrenivorans]
MSAVRWGVLTTARIAQDKFLPAMRKARNATVSAISSPNGRAADVAARFDIPVAYSSHEELLADPSIEAVYLPFPNGLHTEWIIAAAEAGKDILCEKPLVGSLEDYARVVEACARNGVSLMEAFMYRFHPQHQKVREFIDAGRIGQIVSMHARFHFVMDRQPGEVRLQTGLEGGAVNDIGCYAVDIMNMVMGKPPVTVYAKGTSPADPVETTVAAILDYDGVIGTMDCGFEGPRTNTFQITGTKGQITLDKAFDPDPGDPARVTVSLRDGSTEVFDVIEDPFKVEIERFSIWARSAGQEIVHQDLTEQNLAVRLAIHESLASGLPRKVEAVHAVEHHLLQEQ